MELPLKQLSKLLTSSRRILVTGPQNPDIDTLSSAVAWWLFLSKQNKTVDIVFDSKINRPKFLPKHIEINNELNNISKFKIVLDVSKTKVKQLSYDLKNNKLHINIVPEDGIFSNKDVDTEQGDYKYDLVVSLGATNLDSLGAVFAEHRHFFHNTSIINIDRSVLNENFGSVDIIEASATSLSEISYEALKKYLDKDIATCLLAGMIASTNSFQSPRVKPHTLELASELIIQGADREAIIEDLYRTKDISTLKNWGRVLSRLKRHENIISSHLQHGESDDLPQDFQEMIKDLILATPNSQVAIIFYQLELNRTEAWLYTINNINALELTKDLQGRGHRRFAKVLVEQDVEKTRELIVKKIASKLKIINSL